MTKPRRLTPMHPDIARFFLNHYQAVLNDQPRINFLREIHNASRWVDHPVLGRVRMPKDYGR